MSTAVVAGCGISGIVSALVLKRKFHKVIIIDKNSDFGGLLRSRVNSQGISFDYGCHFLRDTGHNEVDDLVYRDIKSSDDWLQLDYLKAGSFLNGRLNEMSQFLDARTLDPGDYQAGLLECLEIVKHQDKPKNLAEELEGKFGSILAEKLFNPVIQKFFSVSMDDLVPGANSIFFPQRILALTSDSIKELKGVGAYDNKLGYHSYLDGISGLKNYYPKSGGVGSWISLLEKKMFDSGIIFVKGHGIDKICNKDNRVTGVVLDNQELIDCDTLTWTLPLPTFIKAFQSGFQFEFSPKRLTSTILNYVVDREATTDLHFLTCHDPEFDSFRVTLYPNIQDRIHTEGYHFTVECVSLSEFDQNTLKIKVLEELKKMGVFPSDTKFEYCEAISMPNTFPIPTTTFVDQCNHLLERCHKMASNVLFLGRNNGKKWFMNEIMIDSYEKSSEFSWK